MPKCKSRDHADPAIGQRRQQIVVQQLRIGMPERGRELGTEEQDDDRGESGGR